MRERFWGEAPEGLLAVLGEPVVLEVESAGEARTSLEAPPPLLDCAPAPLVAAAAEDASCEADWGAMVLVAREDSSWLAGSCCPAAGEKGDDVDEAADDLRLLTRRDEAGGSEGKLDVAGDCVGRGLLGEGVLVLRCSWAIAVEMGVRRVLWFGLGAPQGCCWLIESDFP
jgi:microcompartment protein CcmK/EutM